MTGRRKALPQPLGAATHADPSDYPSESRNVAERPARAVGAMTRDKGPSKADLLAALSEMVTVGPEEYLAGGEVRCHFCLEAGGRPHGSWCVWVDAAVLASGDPNAARRLVGEDDEDFEDRLEDEEDDEQPERADVRGMLAEMLGGELPDDRPEPSRDTVDALLDLPAGEPFDGDQV